MTKGQVLQLNVNHILNIDDSAAQRPVLVDNVTALMNVTLGNIHFTLPKTKQTSSKQSSTQTLQFDSQSAFTYWLSEKIMWN
ncbi:hypothetical protein DPMN_130446 [Dreissena polymorpha]|uniref:Uncharacterized protein n=1 Tax=Dreissena polymorpha TaxID=45954 RepID=A0A9D4H4L2_DREPO|nr:hypothetical protein DPMN_130446 [Dreissena polymorpha]